MPTPDEVTALVQAAAAGADIEFQALDLDPRGEWQSKPRNDGTWFWDVFRYRIKPATPRRCLVWFDAAGRPQCVSFNQEAALKANSDLYGPVEFVEVVK